jgi:hypothetical protein
VQRKWRCWNVDVPIRPLTAEPRDLEVSGRVRSLSQVWAQVIGRVCFSSVFRKCTRRHEVFQDGGLCFCDVVCVWCNASIRERGKLVGQGVPKSIFCNCRQGRGATYEPLKYSYSSHKFANFGGWAMLVKRGWCITWCYLPSISHTEADLRRFQKGFVKQKDKKTTHCRVI